jgi:DNA-binding NtrC family response regulator
MAASAERLELAVFSASGVTTHALVPGRRLVLGRAEDADVRIDDAGVSRRHAVFHAGPPLEVEDLGSANGTFVTPGAPAGRSAAHTETAQRRSVAVGRTPLHVGDSLAFGSALVVVRAARSPAATGASEMDGLVRDPAIARVYDEAARAARMALPVLIVGETGAGKDVLARFVHDRSPRAAKPYVALNCAAISESLADSELFGHERGAFTGAQQSRAGVFEAASGGTLFLDELGELPLATQAKLLRALESSEIQRVGRARPVPVDVRVISATHCDLERDAADGRFRQDLYFRVSGIVLHVPPLRQRRSEIVPLALQFLRASSASVGLPAPPELARDATEALEAHAWPGNVRELRYAMERAIVSAGAGPITAAHLPPAVRAPAGAPGGKPDPASRERLVEALAACDGNQSRAAERLGVSRRTLINRMIEYGLPRPRRGR